MEKFRITESEYYKNPAKWRDFERSIDWIIYEHNFESGYIEWTYRVTPGEAHNK